MGWVLKELRTDRLDAMREDAERDARRIRRVADRTAGSVADDLRQLEELAVELQGTVRRRRLSTVAPARAPDRVARAAESAGPVVVPPRRRRAGRASMRASPLTDLLRATPSRPRFPRALLEAR